MLCHSSPPPHIASSMQIFHPRHWKNGMCLSGQFACCADFCFSLFLNCIYPLSVNLSVNVSVSLSRPLADSKTAYYNDKTSRRFFSFRVFRPVLLIHISRFLSLPYHIHCSDQQKQFSSVIYCGIVHSFVLYVLNGTNNLLTDNSSEITTGK